MAMQLDFQRQMRTLGNVSPERMAVPNATPLVENMARAEAGQMLQDRGTGLAIQGMRDNTALMRQDMRLARQDTNTALGVTGLNLGANMLVNRERGKIEQERMRMQEEENTYWQSIGEVMARFGDDILKRLTVEGGK